MDQEHITAQNHGLWSIYDRLSVRRVNAEWDYMACPVCHNPNDCSTRKGGSVSMTVTCPQILSSQYVGIITRPSFLYFFHKALIYFTSLLGRSPRGVLETWPKAAHQSYASETDGSLQKHCFVSRGKNWHRFCGVSSKMSTALGLNGSSREREILWHIFIRSLYLSLAWKPWFIDVRQHRYVFFIPWVNGSLWKEGSPLGILQETMPMRWSRPWWSILVEGEGGDGRLLKSTWQPNSPLFYPKTKRKKVVRCILE